MMALFLAVTQIRCRVACPGRYGYILICGQFRFIQPCCPIHAATVPAGDGWVHEVKFDGYRIQAQKLGSRVVIYSRNGHDFTERFPSIAQLLHELPAKAAVLDGEVVASDANGRPNFARLHGGPPVGV
jgi:bifunctional non-homologous end joining protein LigD